MLEDIKCVAYALIAACGVYAWLYAWHRCPDIERKRK